MPLDQMHAPLDLGYARGDALVEPQWLRAHLHDPGLRLVEIDVSPTAYDAGHIDGAVLWNVYSDLKDSDYRFVGTEAFVRLLRRSGVSPGSTVVFYGYAPAMGLWLMRLLGHRDARILNCSRQTWERAGGSLSAQRRNVTASTYPLPRTLAPIRADLPDVRAAIADPACAIVDVRTEAEFAGRAFWPSGGAEPGGRAGHVPSALHVPLDTLHDDAGAYRDAASLRETFAALGTTEAISAKVITYCTIGGRASTAWFVLTDLLGREGVSVFEGSWAEWGRSATTEVAVL